VELGDEEDRDVLEPTKNLPREVQLELVQRAQAGDRRARDTLIRTNVGLVRAGVSRWRKFLQGHEEDAFQDGLMGLNHAIDRYEAHRGTALSTIAVPWISQHILRGLHNRNGAFRVPVHVWDSDRARAMRLTATPVSLDSPVREDAETTRLDLTPSPTPGPEEQVAAESSRAEARARIAEALEGMREREREVIEWRYLADAPLVLREVGERWGVTRTRAEQVEKGALRELARRLGVVVDPRELARSLNDFGATRETDPRAPAPPPGPPPPRCSGCGKRINYGNSLGRCYRCVGSGGAARRRAQLALAHSRSAASAPPPTQENPMPAGIPENGRTCSVAGCENKLRSNNTTGKCPRHAKPWLFRKDGAAEAEKSASEQPRPSVIAKPKPTRPERRPAQLALVETDAPLPDVARVPNSFLLAAVDELIRRRNELVAATRRLGISDSTAGTEVAPPDDLAAVLPFAVRR
jgi:RNA polymerase sigma factor (sigma-70 family)